MVSDVSANVDHRTRTAAQAGARRAARLRMGTARTLPAVWHDVHCPAQLVRAVWALHAALPTTSLGRTLQRRQRMGTGHAALPGSHSSARSEYAASLGLAENDQPVVCGQSLLVGLSVGKFLRAPTILTWDWPAASRILLLETNSP